MNDRLRAANVKRVLGALEKLAKNDAEKYQTFWNEFGRVMKEGPAEDMANKDKLAGLLRFVTSQSADDQQAVSLDQYIERMAEGQTQIYYITADNLSAARNSPHLEIFKKKDIEVLLLVDRVDEWLVSHLTEYQDKKFSSVAKGELDLGEIKDKEKDEADKESDDEFSALIEKLQKNLDDSVKSVRVSHRLVDSPACLVVEENEMSANLARVLKSVGQDAPDSKPILEVNTSHPMLKKLAQENEDDKFSEWAHLLFEQALLAEGGQLQDPSGFVHRLNKLLLDLA
ncbi:MAG: hypothetical protein KZQ58_08165 [gamma proteobacterium symbiont of Bathyaustriella thionipta]|nr:hypothetical protein [gamma proteobacterium symbiont of Bathyaustriella thionipta]